MAKIRNTKGDIKDSLKQAEDKDFILGDKEKDHKAKLRSTRPSVGKRSKSTKGGAPKSKVRITGGSAEEAEENGSVFADSETGSVLKSGSVLKDKQKRDMIGMGLVASGAKKGEQLAKEADNADTGGVGSNAGKTLVTKPAIAGAIGTRKAINAIKNQQDKKSARSGGNGNTPNGAGKAKTVNKFSRNAVSVASGSAMAGSRAMQEDSSSSAEGIRKSKEAVHNARMAKQGIAKANATRKLAVSGTKKIFRAIGALLSSLGVALPIIAVAIVVIITCFLLGSSLMANKIFEEENTSEMVESLVPCTISGTINDNGKMNLIVTYEGTSIKGIKGTLAKDGTFTASKKSGTGLVSMPLPKGGGDPSSLTFMRYSAVTAVSSPQYKLLNSSLAKDVGVYRMVGGKYAIALGSFYGSKIGEPYTLKFEVGGKTKTVQCVLGDQKADQDTNSTHQYHTVDGSIVEFVTSKNSYANMGATGSQIRKDFGKVVGIYKGGGINIQLTGTVKGKNIEVKGSLNGQEIAGNGTVENGVVNATGYIGDGASVALAGGAGKYVWPVPNHKTTTGQFGDNRGDHQHAGLDIPLSEGTKIINIQTGVCVENSYNSVSGNYVMIRQADGYIGRYQHLCKPSTLKVKSPVPTGATVGYGGNTGRSYGAHLHLEIWKPTNDLSYKIDISNRIDPAKVLPKP